MEVGSCSFGDSGESASTDSLNGLKFGKKIYFENVGAAVSSKSGAISGSPSKTTAVAPKRGRCSVQGGKPLICQVEGCMEDLTGAKAYYCRHKVCGMHSKAPKVIVNGMEQRFCQQCSRFHQLPEFDQGKRSCRRRLACHNERRRKPPSRPLTSNNRSLPFSLYESVGQAGGFPMDSTCKRSAGREVWPLAQVGKLLPSNPSSPLERHPHLWDGCAAIPSNLFVHESQQYLHVSTGGASFADSCTPSCDTFMGMSDSRRALSLLSSQHWCHRSRASNTMATNCLQVEMPASVVPEVHNADTIMSRLCNPFRSQGGSNLHEIVNDFGLAQVPESFGTRFSDVFDSAL